MVKKEDFIGKDMLYIDDFSREEIDYIISNSGIVAKNPEKYSKAMKGKIMATFFSEPSSRTKNSFKMAMYRMAGNVLDFDIQSSSLKKGETLEDTAKIIDGYEPDVVVIRYKTEGVPKLFSDNISAPVISGGEGTIHHLTQALLDLYTVNSFRGGIDGLKIAIVGDLKYGRTVRSLSIALTKYENCEIFFMSPESLKISKELATKLSDRNLIFRELNLSSLEEVIGKVDVLYMTRIQRERFPEGPEGEHQYKLVSSEYRLTMQMLDKVNKPEFKIMHPLPKVDEIEKAIDYTKYAYYFEQAKNGLPVRKLLLMLVIGVYKDGK